MSEPLWC